jgi:23S rRNA (uracil1939-C5)-methyltransferase
MSEPQVMPLQKNETYSLKIDDLTHDGAGVAKMGGVPIFIPGALIGEEIRCRIIQVKSKYAIGKLEAVLQPSKDRVLPPCAIYGKCGGCQLQHLDYGAQLQWKQHLVQRHMRHIAKSDVRVYPPIAANENPREPPLDLAMNNQPSGENGIQRAKPFEEKKTLSAEPKAGEWRYRHKAILPFGVSPNGTPILGFYAPHSHRVVPVSDCLIQAGPFAEIVSITLSFVRDSGLSVYDEEKHKGLLRALVIRRSATTGKLVVGLSLNAKTCPALSVWVESLQALPEIQGVFLCQNFGRNNVPLSGAILPLWGDLVLRETLGEISFALGPLSFFQVNPAQAAHIVAYLKALPLGSSPIIWDLYAGVGTMGLVFARASSVVCVEMVPEAAQLCRLNASENGLDNVHVIEGSLESSLDQLASLPLPDMVILDPPRQGCHESVLDFLQNREVPLIVYISCDPATFARDSLRLSAAYRCTDVQPIDMFPMTRHVEVIGVFQRIRLCL